jgi:regulator of replication initiation timing
LIEDSRRSVRKELAEFSKDKDSAVEEAQRLEIELEQLRAHANSEISELQSTYKREIELLSASLREES